MQAKLFTSIKDKVNKTRINGEQPKEQQQQHASLDPRGSTNSLASSHDTTALASLQEENKRLRNELEILAEQKDQNAMLKTTVQSLIDEVNTLKASAKAVVAPPSDPSELQQTLEQERSRPATELQALQQDLDQAKSEREEATPTPAVVQQVIDGSSFVIDALKAELQQLKESHTAASNRHTERIAQLELELDQAKLAPGDAQGDGEALGSRLEQLHKDLTESRAKLAEAQAEHDKRMEEQKAQMAGEMYQLRLDATAAQEKLQRLEQASALSKQKEQSLNEELEKARGMLTQRENALASAKMDVHNVQMQLEQCQAEHARASATSQGELEKKLKADFDKRLKKEKDSLTADLDKARKDLAALEQSKGDAIKKLEKDNESKREELRQRDAKTSQLEKEMTALREKYTKQVDDLNKLIVELNGKLTQNKEVVDKAVAEADQLRRADTQLRSEVETLTSQLSTVTAELEVKSASNERNAKSLSERDVELKILKTAESLLKAQASKLEKDFEELRTREQSQGARLSELEAQVPQLETSKADLESKLSTLQAQHEALTAEKQELQKKYQDLERDLKITEKKGAQMVRDLQKELAKGRPKESHRTSQSNLFGDIPSATSPQDSTPSKRGHSRLPSLSSKISDDSSSTHGTAHDRDKHRRSSFDTNPSHNSNDEQLKHLQERLQRALEESDLKSKTIQQLVLRENAAFLDKSVRDKPSKIDFNALSTKATMQKLDPALLSEINTKLQRLLEENTIKNMQLQEDMQNLSQELHNMKKAHSSARV
ncbi:hypothetical protein RI367_004364 [Sorochytrium milnesiophthora]